MCRPYNFQFSALGFQLASSIPRFSSLQYTLMHFVVGNEDFGVFIQTCGRTSWDGSCDNGCGVLSSVSDSLLPDEKMVSA